MDLQGFIFGEKVWANFTNPAHTTPGFFMP